MEYNKCSYSYPNIVIENGITTRGFFVKAHQLNWLFILNYTLSDQLIIINYNSRINQIKLDSNERLIIKILDPLEVTLIEILENDNIYNIEYILPDYNYNNGYKSYIGQEIGLEVFTDNQYEDISSKIEEINNKYIFKFFSNSFSTGLPILLKKTNTIVGIQTKMQNYGIFIGIFLEKLNNILEIEKENRNNDKKIKNKVYINKLDYIIKKDDYKKYKIINELDDIIKKDDILNKNYNKFFHFLNCERNSEYFVKASIFDKDDYFNYKNDFDYKFNNNKFSELEKSCIGSILGMAIGDAMGARVEFLPVNYDESKKVIKDMGKNPGGKFKLEPGQWTDDTSMGLCIADSLIENKGEFEPHDIMMRFILWWHFGYNNAFRYDKKRKRKHSVGLGGNISGSLKQYIKDKGKDSSTKYGDRNTSGNGSIMRNAAIPICYFNEKKKALKYAKKQSLITHKGDEAAGCCQLLTFIIWKILTFKTKQYENKVDSLKDILEDLTDFNCEYKSVNYLAYSKQEGDDENKNWNWKDINFKYSEDRVAKKPGYIGSYCMDGLAMALHKLYKTKKFEDAILEGVNLCGDADSVGSIIGQIAGAFYGLDSIPKDWIKKINDWDNREIALRGYILCHLKEKINK